MKKILLFIIVLLPFLGIGQTTFASWSLDGTTAATSQSYITPTNFALGDDGNFSGVYTSDGVALGRWSNSTYDNDRYIQVSIAATPGNYVNINEFNFQYKNNSNGPTRATIKYLILNSGDATPSDANFLSNANTFTGWTDNTLNTSNTTQTVSVGLNLYLQPAQRIVVRFYGRDANNNSRNFTFLRNSLNFKGCKTEGDPSVYGTNSWIGYVYNWVSGPETNEDPLPNNYLGYVTENAEFDRVNGTGAISGATSSFCGTAPSGSFFVRYKMNVNLSGKFAVTVGGDDGYRLSVDGGATWEINNWSQHSYQTTTKEICLNGSTNVVLEYFEGPVDSRVSFSYVDVTPVAPTSVSGTNNISCGTSTILTANGTTVDGVNTFFEWGTGTVGSNVIAGATSNTYTTPNLTSTTTYWVRVTSPGTCVYNTAAQTRTVTVSGTPSAPTGISGTTSVCSGNGTTLTATGGSGTTYQWGTGTVGENIISGATTASLATGNLTSDTTYWVRRGSGTCFSAARTVTVTVTEPATAPTSITGADSYCPGAAVILTASGGSGATYQWGTGAIGSNIFTGQTASTITVNPNANTTYWVRRQNNIAPCTGFTGGVTKLVTVGIPGAPAGFGDNEWNVFGYTGGGNSNPTGYSGYYVQNLGTNVGVDTKLKWGMLTSPSAASDWNGCSISSNTAFTFIHKRKGFPCGNYLLNYTYYDDETTIIIKDANGDTYTINSTGYYNGGAGLTQAVNGTTTYALDANSTIEIRTTNSGVGEAKLGITFTANAYTPPVAPTSITGVNSICSGTSTTLTATAGLGTYQWGTGTTVGVNPIAGTTNTITVSPTSTTTYWVRVKGTFPCPDSAGITYAVTVTAPPVAPTSITGTNSICSGTSTTLTATAGLGTYEWGTGTVGSNIIGGATTNTYTTPNLTSTTTYWVRVKGTSPCGNSTGITRTVTVTAAPVAPSTITGTISICSGTSTTLTTNAGLGTYEWGTGATVGSNIIAGATSNTYTTPNLASTTTYWVRVKATSPCTTDSAGITRTVTVTLAPVAPTTITGTTSICSGTSTTLTATAGLGTYEWGTGATVGSNIIAGATTNTYTTPNLTSNTTYWVRVKGTSPCGNSSGITTTVTVTPVAVAPTAITGTTSICSGTSTTLTTNAGLGTYEWGTGATVGSNTIAGQTTNTLSTGNLTSTTTYWVRVKGTSPCGDSSGITTTVTVTPAPVRPSSLTSTSNSICSGTQITLTANGTSGTFEWGTGATVGNNIILGESSSTLIVSPSATTTYWVRVLATSPCTTNSLGRTRQITVTPSATAPTAITGIETSYCAGDAITLTASGGTGTTYEWGTGATIGSNIINGATTASISVSPSSTTTYWVRRQSTSPCSGATSGVTKTITVLPTPGDPAVFGTNEWNVYGYNSGGNSNPSDYRGYYVQNLGSNAGIDTKVKWSASTSPSAATDWQGCPVNNDGFTMVHKRKGFPCGRYNIAFTYYDEDTVVIITDATGTTSTLNFTGSYNGGVGLSQPINGSTTYALDGNSTIEIRTTDITPSSEAKLGMTITGASTSIYNGTWNQEASYTDIEIQSDYNLPADITVCTCTVVDGKTFTVPANKTLTVIGNTTAVGTGKFIIENNGGFVQVNDNSTYTGVPTSFTSKRQTQSVYRYDITYWSSPVENFVLKNVSPLTLFDKFFSWNSNTQAWTPHKTNVDANLLEIMGTGKGYSIRAPQSFNIEGTAGALPQTHMAQFIGIPHNGVKQITVANGAANKWNMIGNPYPSALNIAEFLKVNKDVVDGTLYFWTHKTPVIQNSPNPDYALYSATDYVAVNLSGNISNGNDSGIVASAPSGNSLGVTTGDDFLNVASGQSFFIKGKETGAIGNQVTFNNKMRVRTGGENAQFFKPGVTTPVNNWQNTGKHRIWLNATTSQNDFNQTLVGYIQNATNGLDWGYDGEALSSGAISIYSMLNDQKLSIQARSLPFTTQDEVPLGYTTTRTGTARITLDKVDGLFQGQDIYLEDNLLNVVHNLKNASYTFNIVPGTFNDRFVLRYLPSENLGTDLPTLDVNALVIYNLNNQISVKAKDFTIESVIIYDMQGRVLFTKNQVNAQEFTTQSLAVYKQVVLVKVITENKAEVVKKVILN